MKWKRNNKVIETSISTYLESLIKEEKEKGYTVKIAVGTDSQISGRGVYKFATVILLLTSEDLGGGVIVGRGGMVVSAIYHHTFKKRDKELVNERMVFEVGKSVETAYEIAPMLDSYGIEMEIHADINPDPIHESNKALQTAVGYILGMGYSFKIKPSSPAASYVADWTL